LSDAVIGLWSAKCPKNRGGRTHDRVKCGLSFLFPCSVMSCCNQQVNRCMTGGMRVQVVFVSAALSQGILKPLALPGWTWPARTARHVHGRISNVQMAIGAYRVSGRIWPAGTGWRVDSEVRDTHKTVRTCHGWSWRCAYLCQKMVGVRRKTKAVFSFICISLDLLVDPVLIGVPVSQMRCQGG